VNAREQGDRAGSPGDRPETLDQGTAVLEAVSPVQIVDTGSPQDDDPRNPQEGIALCLSGGGYRAMLFHLGALTRLNEWGYLKRLARISSVSGGSIAAAMLGLEWNNLAFDGTGKALDFDAKIVQPIRGLASKTIDEGSIFSGILLPGSIADRVADAYRKYLFGDATLQDLPPDPPRFVINATNVQTGALFRFSRPYAADYRVGRILNPKIDLAVAVAASSAFPPLLSPMRIELDRSAWAPPSGQASEDLHKEPYLTDVVLSDGGVYDNLGLETAWKKYKTILVSNGGGKMQPEPDPESDWARHALRINDIIDNQVRSLRVRQVIAAFQADKELEASRNGTYWGIRSDLRKFRLSNALPCPLEKTTALANVGTRLKRLESIVQEQLMNWGYAACDAAMRKWVDPGLSRPGPFPYPVSGI
jgi:NTE family protein